MSAGIKQRLAGIVGGHEYMFGVDTNCRCGEPSIWTWDDYRAHVADAITESLGFTRETDGESSRWSTDWEA